MSAKSQPRTDFRCGICQRKDAFHCEHATPYRDQYLIMKDSNIPRNSFITSRSPRNGAGTSNTSISNGGINTRRQVHPKVGGAQYQQNKNLNTTKRDNKHTNQSSNIYEQNQKSKSCVIL